MSHRLQLALLLLLTVTGSLLTTSQQAAASTQFNPLDHRMTMIQSRLMLLTGQEAFFEGQLLQQSARVASSNLISAMEHSICPLGDDQQQVRLQRIETFGLFLRLIALAEDAQFTPPDTLPPNQYYGLRLLQSCKQGQHDRLLEAALELVDANRG
ncbi:MAG: hypothetical protein IBX50_05465 [Marinospirillum sp.]|uniref:hypothetical protein n=1 Tax=Marinospirillum sp. TaxID=2183934 RepID=UPI0019EBAB9C|nr:hypothetical protein [Marinospirillum sp.]MBE0506155.1 hypothetical protein [Marinospirillum sp.]